MGGRARNVDGCSVDLENFGVVRQSLMRETDADGVVAYPPVQLDIDPPVGHPAPQMEVMAVLLSIASAKLLENVVAACLQRSNGVVETVAGHQEVEVEIRPQLP